MPTQITHYQDQIDSRDVQERIDELTAAGVNEPGDITDVWEELRELQKLREAYIEMYNESSWRFGAQFIRDSYFEDYAQELAEDIGAINAEAVWPNNFIDWERAASELKMDYMSIEFGGVDFWTQEA